MATVITRYLQQHFELSVACSDPTTPASNGPVRFGELTGIALTNEGAGGNIATETTVEFGAFEATLSVKAVDDAGNSAVAVGDTIYYVDADTPKLSKKASGYFYGIAMATVTSGATATIKVAHFPAGSWVGTVNTGDIAAGAVTAAKLSSTLKTGYIPLPLAQAREIVTNDIPATAADAGVLSSNTTPILGRVNGATDKKLRLTWAATNVDAITWDVAYPPDLDDTAAVVVNILAAMGGVTDTPTVAVNYFEGLGDTNAGGATAAVTGTTIAKYTRSIAAADVGVYPNAASVELVPGAHGTDTLLVYGCWLEYTRK